MDWIFKFLERYRFYHSFLEWTSRVILPGFNGLPLYTVSVFFYNELRKEALFTKASSLAFHFLLAIFPFIIFLFTLIPHVPIPDFQTKLFLLLQEVLPTHAFLAAESTIGDIMNNRKFDLLSIGFLSSMYFSTNGIGTLMKAFNKSSLSPETRPFLKQQWTAIWLTFTMVLLLVVSVTSIIASELLISWLRREHIFVGGLVSFSLQSARWLIIAGLYLLAVSLLYYYGPSRHRELKFFTPGAIFATILAIIASILFTFFISNFGTYNKIYGSIGALIIIMLWLYFNSIILLLGFELNASIELSKRSIKVEPLKNTYRGTGTQAQA
ncbi:membrane protein [Anseongella ginsenosidimutans]|uniref:Membrane protein n=1 Tax=Anseongella ginsenosidimutans TaxID=496056 RepID=A0A4R3KVL6_9SPHI|nr:YihY/virulence factor BrkB family protein [Anseongella ginsenosidimutans]QEC53507.1 YihY/virulence factor BrkB family protein [Anseongella ginsenosidimutans]TCS88409.1 membrane protein [Anseongella ginsenosidimutans]